VQPALENFYGTLTDEQKARFNELGAHQNEARRYRHALIRAKRGKAK
jgi:hypothetical protein